MLALNPDTILIIAKDLSDKDKISLTMTTKIMDGMKYRMRFVERILVSKISKLAYFDNFEYVKIRSAKCKRYPGSVKYVYFVMNRKNMKSLKGTNMITHLKISDKFVNPINEGTLAESVTHLTFGAQFNQSIEEIIPSSVTHLTFGWCFNESITNNIPSTVTHLTFGGNFNQPIRGNIPGNVTHLTFDHRFNQPIKKSIPESVTYLKFGDWFNQPIKGNLLHI